MITYGIMQGRLTEPNGKGIQFFPFDNWENEFRICKQIGLDEIEFIFDYDEYERNPLWTESGIHKVKSLIEESGVVVKSLCFDYFMRRAFYKCDERNRDITREENKMILLKMFESMNFIGGKLIEIPSVDNSTLSNEVERSLYLDFLKEIIRDTEKEYSHIKIGLETDLPVEEFVVFLDSVGSKRVGANYDSGNSSGLGYNLYEEVKGLGSRILNVHIKDRIYKGPTVALGTGSADFNGLFTAFKEIGYNNSFIIQAARGKDGDETETIKQQYQFIMNNINSHGMIG